MRSTNPQIRELCAAVLARLAELREKSVAELRSLQSFDVQMLSIGGRNAQLATYADSRPDGGLAVVVQGFMNYWGRPNYFGTRGVGSIYAEGLVVSADGEVGDAPDQLLWEFR